MKSKFLPLSLITVLMVTGCSSPVPVSEPEYDEVELMVYNLCIEKMVSNYLDKGFFGMVPTFIENAEEECKELKPLKK
jgi:hypothetical protein